VTSISAELVVYCFSQSKGRAVGLAKIFKPIRWQAAATEAEETVSPSRLDDVADIARHRENRMGTPPVTNTSPSGPDSASLDNRKAHEETWTAMLELVFAETGWPDA
jgi:hypothetical protein